MSTLWDLIRPNIRAIKPYVPGKSKKTVWEQMGVAEACKLASNENRLGMSPLAREAILAELSSVPEYPDDSASALKEAIAGEHNVPVEWVVVGNGASDILQMLAQALFDKGDEAILGHPAFILYEILCQIFDAVVVKVPNRDWKLDLDGFAKALTDRTNLIWIDNPNNPCGTYCSTEEISTLVKAVDGRAVIVLDEAYCHFADAPDFPNGIDFVREWENVAVVRTFSKIGGLAGLRCGYGIMRPPLSTAVEALRIRFNVNRLAQVAAAAAIRDHQFIAETTRMVREGREFFYDRLNREYPQLRFVRSQGNYILIDFGFPTAQLCARLESLGVIVRPGEVFGVPNCIRVTVGTEEDNSLFFEKLREALSCDCV